MISNNIYAWQKRLPVDRLQNGLGQYKRIAFKTANDSWVNTTKSVIVLFSINSSFHKGPTGLAKIRAFVSIIQNYVKGRIVLLVGEKAHMHVDSLNYDGDIEKTLIECNIKGNQFTQNFLPLFKDLDLQLWDTFITKDPGYKDVCNEIETLFHGDQQFKILIVSDAQSTYTASRAVEFPHENLFVENAVKDLLEQVVATYILSKKGYIFQFYPGKPYASIDYFIKLKTNLTWISVFLSLEKK